MLISFSAHVSSSFGKKGYPAIWQQIAEMQCAGVQIRPKLSSAMMLSGAFTAILTGVVFLYRYADFNGTESNANLFETFR